VSLASVGDSTYTKTSATLQSNQKARNTFNSPNLTLKNTGEIPRIITNLTSNII